MALKIPKGSFGVLIRDNSSYHFLLPGEEVNFNSSHIESLVTYPLPQNSDFPLTREGLGEHYWIHIRRRKKKGKRASLVCQ